MSDDLDDLSAFEADAPAAAPLMGGNDNDTLKQIKRRTSPAGKIVLILVLLAIGGAGVMAFRHMQASDSRMEVFEPIAAMEDAEQRNSALRNALENAEFEDVKIRAIRNLGHYRDANSVPQLIQALDGTPQVRRDAAWALARIGSPAADQAKAKLLEVLPETNEVDRNQVVWTLATLNAQDQAVLDALIARFSEGGLQELDGFDERVITRVLGTERLSSPDLTGHEVEGVRVLTAHALAEAGGEPVVAPLSRMLTEELGRQGQAQSSEVIRAAAAGLGRTGSPNGAEALFQALQRAPQMKDTVVDALKKSTGAPQIATMLERATGDVREDLVGLLAESHDRRVVDTFASLLQDEAIEIRAKAARALANFGDRRAVPVLLEMTALTDNDELVSDALEDLRLVASPEITAQLGAMLETHAYRKAVVLRALGATGDAGAARFIERELNGDDVAAAARALAELDHDASYRKLLGFVVRPRNTDMTAFNAADRSLTNEMLLLKRKAAIQAIGIYGRADAIDELMQVVEDGNDDYELRGMAAASIGQIGDAEGIARVIGRINDATTDEHARRYYVQTLWQRALPELNSALLGVVVNTNADPNVRRAAGLALGYAADPANDERLSSLLDDESTRQPAAFAVVLGGGDAVVEKLRGLLETDGDLREILQQYVSNTENDWFNLIRANMFDSGAIWRRIRAAQILQNAEGTNGFSYPWQKMIAVLRSGWDGVGGVTPQYVRDRLYEGLSGDDPVRRELAAKAFVEMPELGLLLRARDEGGEPGEAARAVLAN
ncbi:MAG: HEAT repeat domain-containing protein [Sandaracinus sp.]|nr:HEAT repeat domain-containing protein [Sandaracinus sp.]MCB9624900.1 HEAT repeat domain-containing protein [Sandaracinus sp.]MCB9632385.1 HEAT repeat domain-containing protein [Sandaracinus sp.]